MIWIKILKMIWIIISVSIGIRAGLKLDEKMSDLKWYDVFCRYYWFACVGFLLGVVLVGLWEIL